MWGKTHISSYDYYIYIIINLSNASILVYISNYTTSQCFISKSMGVKGT